MEVRAGGEKEDKMYKFYVHSITGLRLLSKQDVLLYINEAKVSGCDTNGQRDTTSEDNILSKVDFRPSGLPEGWVKELVYRKTKEGLIRRDPYYTDPVSSYTFHTLKSASSFLETGKVSERAFIQRTSVHDLYSFEISADMVIVLLVFSLSSENLHDILCSSCLHFGHYHAEIKGSEFCFLAT
ncbi:hypothetical protein Zm00014a_011224 [Zea mays]|uniref:Methyl-CpG-binding domain-containing protein 13 n=2 Tax=Zea mays TaxID=4577 RepID=A0A3L6DAG6_MAIZE|nr:Methyl-CpG-binding domain-containing protein 13 [Zea mays]PWZ05526.1 hypothetical protein Zm00014a_011224 [Zea mays]